MARSYARLITAIWRNKEFRALDGESQRVYMLLVTQPNISAAGTLPLTVRRWAEMATDTSVADVNRALSVLAAGRFIGLDYSTEEVLVRSFVRWDGGFGNRKRRPVIIDAAKEVSSSALRAMLAGEFERLGLPFDELAQEPVTGSNVDGDGGLNAQVDRLSDRQPDAETPFDRVVGCQGEYLGAATHNPQPIPPSAAVPAAVPVDAKKAANKAAQELTRAYTDVVKLSNFPAVMSVVKKARNTGEYGDPQIRAALERLAADGRSVTTDALRYELEGFPASRASPNSTDANIAALMQRGIPTLRALPGGAS
jgi:hypothetical protein